MRDEVERARKAAETRVKHLEECYGFPHRWQLVRKGFDPVGRNVRSGYLAKYFVVLRCLEHPEEGEVYAGVEEAKQYAGVNSKRPGPGRPRKYRRELA
jgi:hypothetical protein